jgi:hypothetical protein
MASFRYELSLRMEHPDADLSAVCGKLDLVPARAWRAGEPRITPAGNPLAGTYERSYCTIDIKHGANELPCEALRGLVKRLMSKKELLEELSGTGGNFNVFIGWYSNGNSGERFDWSVLRDLADLKLSLDLDIYC